MWEAHPWPPLVPAHIRGGQDFVLLVDGCGGVGVVLVETHCRARLRVALPVDSSGRWHDPAGDDFVMSSDLRWLPSSVCACMCVQIRSVPDVG